MPTQTFTNLSEDKKNKIFEAAIKEFSSVPFEKASINKIIKDAGISRGSFYMYFEDIYDLAKHLMSVAKIHIISEMQNRNIQRSDRLDNIILAYHDVVFDYYNNPTYRNFFRNIMMHMQGRSEEELQSMKNDMPIDTENILLAQALDWAQFRNQERHYVMQVIELSLVLFRNVMFKTFMLNLGKEESSKLLEENLEILKHGYGRM